MNNKNTENNERVNPKKELEKIRAQIYNAEHNIQIMKAVEKRLIELSR